MMIVVKPFARRQQRNDLQIGRRVFEISRTHRVIRAVHHSTKKDISARLHQESDAAPNRPK